jgi:Carboxypeptidase regulatory-like domain
LRAYLFTLKTLNFAIQIFNRNPRDDTTLLDFVFSHIRKFANTKRHSEAMSLNILKNQFCSFAVCLFFTQILLAQTPTQTVRGRVLGFENNEILVGASVSLSDTKLLALTDNEGVFRIENVPVGRYKLTVSFVGFKPYEMPDVWVQSGKEVVLTINLNQSVENLETFTTTTSRFANQTVLSISNSEDYLKYPANFNDPARMITYLPGAATDNDQGNNISVRGNTPNALQWYLEGAEIVNPNHLSNAGTPSDRTTANGGGVLILGANMMESANFYKGAMSADKGGALTSIMDLNLRKGNDSKRQTSVSLGLIGTEVGTEGYFSKGNREQAAGGRQRASYLVHYRYSTVGLLSKMGVPLGDEAITYQDLTYNLNFPTQKAGNFNFFGMHGFSDNVFKNKIRKEWETEKDSQDITFKNLVNVVGLKHMIGVGKNAIWNTVVAYSGLNNSREAMGYDSLKNLVASESFENKHSKIFIKSKIDWQAGSGKLQAGFVFKNENIGIVPVLYKGKPTNSLLRVEGQDNLIQPFVEWSGKIEQDFQYHLGVRASVLTKAKESSFEPSLGFQYNFGKSSSLSLDLSRQSQSLSPIIYAFQEFYKQKPPVSHLHLTKADNLNLNYRTLINNRLDVNIGTFYQILSGIPQTAGGNFNYITAMDELDNTSAVWEMNTFSKGRNVGAEIDFNALLLRGVHWRLNATVYDSKIASNSTNNSGTITKERNARYNGRYIVNALAGKEWLVGKKQNKFWGINGHIIVRGGFWESPINEAQSKLVNATIIDYGKPFSVQLKDYFRSDISVYFKRNRLKWSSTLQLDIQNVTNQQNEGWHYYDRFQKKVVTKYQLGMIPNLSYRVDF